LIIIRYLGVVVIIIINCYNFIYFTITDFTNFIVTSNYEYLVVMIKITKYFITVETVIIIEVIAKELEVTEVIINFIIFASNLIYLEVEVIIVVITLYLEVITALDWSC